jgi:hypothetical protein
MLACDAVGLRRHRAWLAVGLGHVVSTLTLFGGVLAGRLVFFRDLSTYYAPQYAFAAAALRQGTWPLWNPLANGGEPFLLVYPVDLVLLLVGGGRAPLGVGVVLHLLLALGGASLLGRRLGMGPAGSWVAGTVYGIGGLVLSTVNLVPLFQAAAWAPLVVWALLNAMEAPGRRHLAALAALLATQVSTLGVEIAVQTVLVGVVLGSTRGLWRDPPRLARLALAGLLALLLAAPAVLGVQWLVAGTSRDLGFTLEEALDYSLHPVVLGEALLPGLLGDPHSFSNQGFWGQSYFPTGYPYFVTLYLGLSVLLLAAHARSHRRLWVLAGVGLALALGRFGPLGLLDEGIMVPVRGPQKLALLAHLSLALLAGFGLERCVRGGRASLRGGLLLVLPGAFLAGTGLAAALAPAVLCDLLGAAMPPLLEPPGLRVVTEVWPTAWLTSGALAVGAGLALGRGGRSAFLAGALVALDLLVVNVSTNPLAPGAFYDLRADVAALVEPAAEKGRYRWFSYGVAHTPGLAFEPEVARAESDVWLYYLDRQSLLPRAPALDGLEGAYDVDRTGWSPPGATFASEGLQPERFLEHRGRLRRANVRWVLSFRPLPGAAVVARGSVKLPEIQAPLGLYELRDPLPRAFWTPAPEGSAAVSAAADPAGEVGYECLGPHRVRVTASSPPGIVVLLDGYHPDWTAEDRSGPVPILRVGERWRGVVTSGGQQVFTFRYRPRWPLVAFILAGLGLIGVVVLARP